MVRGVAKPHGLMFHYFHGGDHPEGQGTLSAQELAELLDFIGVERIVSPDEWCARVETNSLDDAICLTFDDGLRSQYDVAVTVLERCSLRAFFFVHTSALADPPTGPELARYLRSTYQDVDGFYEAFFEAVAQRGLCERVSRALDFFDATTYLAPHPFYTVADRRFRFVRDDVLTPLEYEDVINSLFEQQNVDPAAVRRALWLRCEHLQRLARRGHMVGLHSHSHPMSIERMSYEEQLCEYQANIEILSDILGHRPFCMSHPNNSRNSVTFDVLTKLGIRVGFRAEMGSDWTTLDLPREDCANVLAEMRREGNSIHR
jgi:peptidoglycan/xylan/chitin deacetylase (PgdA/CDA1 family)